MHRIVGATVNVPMKVNLVFDDGLGGVYDVAPLMLAGGVFARLADPAVFGAVSIGEHGRWLEWPGDIDLCADALWLEVMNQERMSVA